MKHFSELINAGFYEHDWILLGTGPSLNTFNPNDHKDKNICAIYASEVVCNPNILLAPDEGSFIKYLNYTKCPIITRAFNSKYNNPNTYYFEYDCDIKTETHEGTFHGGDGIRYFPFHEPLPCSCTAKFAAEFFGRAGIKKLYTCGIDGGNEVFSKSPEWYAEPYKNWNNFDEEVRDFKQTASKYNIELIRL